MCSKSLLKNLILAFNFIIFVGGAVVFALGIWMVVKNSGLISLLDEIMLAGVYVLIASGAVVMLIAFLGCYGYTRDSKPAIVIYCTVTLLAVALKTIGCIILYFYYLESAAFLTNSYKTEYGVQVNSTVTTVWDMSQELGSCCGWEDYSDWKNSHYFNKTNRFPKSCCVLSETDNDISCQEALDDFIHKRGCNQVLKTLYYAIGLTTIFIIIFELVAVIFIVAYYQGIP